MKLVCTDLDRTLLPNGEQTESLHARPIFWELIRTHEVVLAYVSGRDLKHVLEAVDEYDLAQPDIIASDVGATIHTPSSNENEWVKNSEWEALLSKNWAEASVTTIHTLLEGHNELWAQEDSRQSLYKRSFYHPESQNESVLRASIESLFSVHSIEASLVFSHDPEKSVGLLDILPKPANKKTSVEFIMSLFDIPIDEVMFAGDSGNDVSAICGANPGVLVANADEITRQQVLHSSSASPTCSNNTYLATGNLPVRGYDDLNGYYAAGIVEALLHFRPTWREHLQDSQWLEKAMNTEPETARISGF